MVVGDDDQTIYEWRGARSDYILGKYENTFTNKPHVTYKLARSFRFGYLIAQTNCNVIQHNAHRLEKHVISSKPAVRSEVNVITDSEEQGGYANRRLVEEIVALVHDKKALPSDIRVLARTYAQLNALQTELLLQRIPFKVIGNAPMFEAGECQSLLNYVRVAESMDSKLTKDLRARFQNISNKPSRFLARFSINSMLDLG